MTLKVAFQMDPIGPININADSTFRIAEEAQARGHTLFYYTPDRLAYQEGRISARGWPLTVRREATTPRGRYKIMGAKKMKMATMKSCRARRRKVTEELQQG